jgi:hypothetical protein
MLTFIANPYQVHRHIAAITRSFRKVDQGVFMIKAMIYKGLWWAFADSNRGPIDYESIALTN